MHLRWLNRFHFEPRWIESTIVLIGPSADDVPAFTLTVIVEAGGRAFSTEPSALTARSTIQRPG